MRRAHAVVLTYALLAAGVCALAQGPHSDTSRPFNGTSLTGWHPQGGAQWRAAGGQIVGKTVPAWYVSFWLGHAGSRTIPVLPFWLLS